MDQDMLAAFVDARVAEALPAAVAAAQPLPAPRPTGLLPPRQATAEKFSGSSKKYREFLFTMETHFDIHGVHDDAQRVRYAVSHLTGFALHWWMAITDGRPPPPEASNWALFKALITSQFADINVIHQARSKLTLLTQKGSVRSLVNDITVLALDIPDITDSELLDKLMGKVRPEVGKHLVTLQPSPTTFQEAAAAAVRYDDLTTFYRSRQPSGNNSTLQQQPPRRPPAGPAPMDLGAMGRPPQNPRLLPKFHPVKGPRCFNCNNYGHLARECRRTKN